MRVKTMLGQAFCRTAYHTGVLRGAMRITEPPNHKTADGRFQILVYHRVGERIDPYVPGVPIAVFDRQMRYLRKHFRILSLTDLLAAAQRGAVPARAIAITFDDGYEDTYTQVLPTVRRYELPITVYLATGSIGDGRPMWNDRIGMAIRDTSCDRLPALPEFEPLPLTTATQRRSALERSLQLLKRRPPAERERLATEIVRKLRVSDERAPRMLRWEQVKAMHAQGVEFGAHTVHHPILTAIPVDAARQEILESKQVIEEQLQTPVAHFAYPNGTVCDFDETTTTLVRRAGFASAVSMIFGTNTPATDRYALRRGGAWEEELALFATKLWWNRRVQMHDTASVMHGDR